MRRFTFLRSLLSLVALCLIGTAASWAETETFDISSYGVKKGTTLYAHGPITEGKITIADLSNQGNTKLRFWGEGDESHLRVYPSNELTVSTSTGIITEISFEISSGNMSSFTPSTGSLSDNTWTGSAESVTFVRSGSDNTQITSISVTYSVPVGYVAPPSFSVEGGSFYLGQSLSLELAAGEGLDIYYALNGSEDYTQYTSSLTINATTIVSAYAQDADGNKSDVVSQTYTFEELVGNAYTPVNSEADLVEGATYLIVNEDNAMALSGISNNKNYRLPVSVTILGGNVVASALNSEGYPYELTLGVVGSNYTFYDATNGSFLSKNSGSGNNLQSANNADSNEEAQWTISFIGNNMTITNVSYSSYQIQYNAANGQQRFSCYTGSQQSVRLYKKVEAEPTEGTFTIGEAGYATLFTDKAFVMPEGVEGAIVDGVQDNELNLNYCYETGSVVPANTGLLLKGEANEYTYEISTETPAAPEVNYLKGSVEEATTTGDGLYYMLSYDQNGENLGFYWGAEDGAAFTNGAGKAYLVLPANVAQNVRGFALDGSTTGIESVTTDTPVAPAAIYTLAGVRVNSTADRLPKGIYIVNGKKVIVK